MEKGIESFLHRHPLKLCTRDEEEVNDDERFVCQGCRKAISVSALYYTCRICNFSLHEPCMDVRQERRGLIHPCTLFLEISPRYSCDVCHQSRNGFVYHCERCKFNVDLECCKSEREKMEMDISHFSHPHHLTLLVPSPKSPTTYCNFCGHKFKDYHAWEYVYGCDKCDFYLHRGCKEYMVREIRHDSHQCPLFLQPHDTRYRCNQCKEESDTSLAFYCTSCDYNLCGACCMMPITGKTIQKENVTFKERVIKNELVGMFPCIICDELCYGPTYFESRQGYLHERCTQLRAQQLLMNVINHYYHPDHPLIKPQKGTKCNLCMCSRSLLPACGCVYCSYVLHLKCTLLTNSVQYDGHKHRLTMVPKITSRSWDMSLVLPKDLKCQRCKGYCYQSSHLFQCGACRFTLHLLCGPLPCTIKHESHVHSLTLTEFLVDEDVYNACCHVCEGLRDPKLAVYYCLECRFIAEIECVISEVLATYRGERGKVKLRTLGARIRCSLVIDKHLDPSEEQIQRERPSPTLFQDKLGSMKQDDKNQWDSVIRYIDTGRPEFLKYPSLMVHRLRNKNPLEFIFFYELKDEEIFNLGECWVPRSFFLGFENLIDQYGDFTATSKMNPTVKSMCLLVLLEFLRSMKDTTTQVVQVAGESYRELWDLLDKFAHYAGFNTLFLKDLREGINRSHLHLQIEMKIEEASTSRGRKIEEISTQIRKLEAEREAVECQFQEYKTSVSAHAQASNWDPMPTWKLPTCELSDSLSKLMRT